MAKCVCIPKEKLVKIHSLKTLLPLNVLITWSIGHSKNVVTGLLFLTSNVVNIFQKNKTCIIYLEIVCFLETGVSSLQLKGFLGLWSVPTQIWEGLKRKGTKIIWYWHIYSQYLNVIDEWGNRTKGKGLFIFSYNLPGCTSLKSFTGNRSVIVNYT